MFWHLQAWMERMPAASGTFQEQRISVVTQMRRDRVCGCACPAYSLLTTTGSYANHTGGIEVCRGEGMDFVYLAVMKHSFFWGGLWFIYLFIFSLLKKKKIRDAVTSDLESVTPCSILFVKCVHIPSWPDWAQVVPQCHQMNLILLGCYKIQVIF